MTRIRPAQGARSPAQPLKGDEWLGREGMHSFALTLHSKTVFALGRVLTFHGAGLVEPDVACSSVNSKGPQVQEVAFNSQAFETAEAIASFKGRQGTWPGERAERGGLPRPHSRTMTQGHGSVLFLYAPHFC